MRGYFGIGIYHPKTAENVGTLWRSAHAFGAGFIFTIGRRYRRQASDTTNAMLHIPLFEYASLDEFETYKPLGCQTVCVELAEAADDLRSINHPPRAAYLLGAEDYGLPEGYMRDKQVLYVPGARWCLNVAVAGSIVLYDRVAKAMA